MKAIIEIFAYICCCVLGYGLAKNTTTPTAMDVYQGKTTLKYITVDGIKVDSIVVFKKDVTNLNIY